MAGGEIMVVCAGCGRQTNLPFAAVKRDSSFCGACGKRLTVQGAQAAVSPDAAAGPKPKRKAYRPARRR